MNKKYRLFVMLYISTLMCSCMCEKPKSVESNGSDSIPMSKQITHRNLLKVSIANAITRCLEMNELDSALYYADSVMRVLPDDPQVYFVRGCIFSHRNDSVNSVESFRSSRALYDSLLNVRPNLSDAMNRARVTQIIDGKEAFWKEMDSLKTVKCYQKDSIELNMWRNLIIEDVRTLTFSGNFRPN